MSYQQAHLVSAEFLLVFAELPSITGVAAKNHLLAMNVAAVFTPSQAEKQLKIPNYTTTKA